MAVTTLRSTLRTLPRRFNALPPRRAHSTTSSVSANELSHFSALASSWWDPQGPSRVLHLMNPLRHDFIASCLAESPPPAAQKNNNPNNNSSNSNNLKYLDVGCGGGIFAESLARSIPATPETAPKTRTQAASITAIDPSSTLIRIARDHARTDPKVHAHLSSTRFQYKNCTLEDLILSSSSSSSAPNADSSSSSSSSSSPHPALVPHENQFDIITLFEVLEHIDATSPTSNPTTFLTDCLRLLRPGGWLLGSTIARSLPSFVVNQVIAEAPWPVGVVPRGTHEWGKFVNPEELYGMAREGLKRSASAGDALQDMRWRCEGVMYLPGIGWKMVSGSEGWGNYFWAVRKGE